MFSTIRKHLLKCVFKSLTMTTAILLSTSNAIAKDRVAGKLASLSGSYKSVQAEDWGRGTFGRREFTFDQGKWTLKFTLALDSEMKMPVFEFRTFGTYTILEKSKKVPNAYNALFLEEKKFVTLRASAPQLVKNFGLANCGLEKNIEKDISIIGCAGWKPVSICNEDHDLLSIDNSGHLFFGKRPSDNDMCTADKRPTQLIDPVVKL